MDERDLENRFIKDISRGDEDAFKELYEATNQKVFGYLYRLTNNQQMAEDVLIETYTEVWKSAKKYKGHSKVLTWIIGIARNLAMSEFRKSKTREYDITENIVYTQNQFLDCAESETLHILKGALNLLPVKHREVLDLVFLHGMRYEDISKITAIPLNTVKTRVFYAKGKLKNILKAMGFVRDDLL